MQSQSFFILYIFLSIRNLNYFKPTTPKTDLDKQINKSMENCIQNLAAIGLKNVLKALQDMKKYFKGFHKNPSSHPDHDIEFITFRRNRRQEILAGKFYNKI